MIRRKTLRAFRRRAVTLVEVVIATLLVGIVLVGALNGLGAVVRGRARLAERERASLIAEELLSEILENPYEDPDGTPVFGKEAGEVSVTRSDCDDVDDFHGWDSTPPQEPDGTPIANISNWRRRVVVEYVDPNDLETATGTNQGAKRITIHIYLDGEWIATRVGVRSSQWKGKP